MYPRNVKTSYETAKCLAGNPFGRYVSDDDDEEDES